MPAHIIMNVLVCVKRVPETGGRIELTPDGMNIETRGLEFTVSPHEECAVEEAIRIIEKHGGSSTVLSLGPPATTEILREALAKGIDRGILLEIEEDDWDPSATAYAIAEAIKNENFDLLLFGNESAQYTNYQVGVRVAQLLDIPCVTGIKSLEIIAGSLPKAVAKREVKGGWEVYETSLPAAFTVKEGINNPRHPSLRGIMAAKRKELQSIKPTKKTTQLVKLSLKKPPERSGQVELLGQGPEAVPKLVEKLREMGVV